MKNLIITLLILAITQTVFAQLTASITNVSNVVCNGNATGAATAVASGGQSPYTYLWSNSATTQTITNLGAGVYYVTVTDSNLDNAYASVTITQPSAINVSTSMIVNPTCSGFCNGVAQISASGGTPPYSYFWSSQQPICTATFCDQLCAGIYSITVTDANSCNKAHSLTITQAPPMTVAITSTTNVTCFGLFDGSATASVAGGTPPYNYQWSSNVTTPSITNHPAGVYCITVTDVNGCMQTACASINQPSEINVNSTVTNASCGEENGSLTSVATNGIAPYVYILEGDTLTNGIATNLPAGGYILQVIDNNGCSKLDTIIINDLGSPSIVISDLQNVTCNGYSDGMLELSAFGGQSPYTISWLHDSELSSFTANNLSSGGYMVTVSDNLNCKKIQTFYITQPGSLFVGVGSQSANCTNPGRATAQGYGGIPPYSYLWSNNDTTQSIFAPQGTYYVAVTDANNCENATGLAIIGYNCKNIIKGKVFSDLNGNCIIDTNETGIQGMALKLTPGNLYASTNQNGEYKFSVNSGTYTIQNISSISPYFYQTCPNNPNFHVVNFSNLGDTINNLNFAYFSKLDSLDLQVFLSSDIARPGFNYKYYINYKYFGAFPINAILKLKHDSILTYNSSSIAENSYSNNELLWNINLLPFAQGYITANFTVPTINNGGTIGRVLSSTATIYPFENDVDTLNNISTYNRIITGSYDPNEKEVYPFGFGGNGAILPTDSLLTYTIRFQNTGTDTAFTVVLVDTLSQFVEPASVVSGASSHPYEFEMYGEGILKWTFNQILLVDSITNEPASHGFVTYTVKQKANNPHETIIANKAEIFFDFNPEIITNTTINTIDIYLNKEIVKVREINSIKLYPNPASDEIFIEMSNVSATELVEVNIYSIDGKKVLEGKLTGMKTRISTSDLESGLYFVEVNKVVNKLIINK